MSFGLGISFGRLCHRDRVLEDVYDEAQREENEKWERTEDEYGVFSVNRREGIAYYWPKNLQVKGASDG